MAYDIGPRIGIKGEKEFNNQIQNINQNLKVLGSELKATTSKFEENANSQDALIAKNKILNQQLDVQKQKFSIIEAQIDKENSKLNDLANALKKATNEFGENSVEVQKAQNAYNKQAANVDKLKVGANETTTYINKLTREIKENDTALSEIDSGVRDAVTGLKKLGDEAKDTANDLDDVSDSANGMSESFAGAFAGGALAEQASNLVGAMKDVVDESKEYMKIMGALDSSSAHAGYTTEQTAETYMQLYGILADDQSAATTTANLQALGLEQDQLRKITEGTIGAWAKYGDSIPIDGLAEAINETVKTGTVTGNFADVLNWAGTSEDAFNEKLQATSSTSERAKIILDELANQGLVDVSKAFRENNAALIESNEANVALKESFAELSEMLLPIFTMITEALNYVLQGFLNLPEPVQNFIVILGGLLAVLSTVAPIIMAISAASTALNISMLPITATILAIAAAVAAIIVVFQNWGDIMEWFGSLFTNITNWIHEKWVDLTSEISLRFKNVMNDISNIANNIKNIFQGIINFIVGVFTGNWARAWEGVKSVFSNIVSGIANIFKSPINFMIDGINSFIRGLNRIKIPDWVPVVGGKGFHISQIPRLKVGMDFVPNDFYPAYLDYGEAVLTKEQNQKFRKMGGVEGMERLYDMKNRYILDSAYKVNPIQNITVENNTYIDGKKIAENTTTHITKNQSNRAFQFG